MIRTEPPATTPLVVITVSDPRRKPDPGLAELKNELYANAVRRAGGNAVLLDPGIPAAARDELLRTMHALLLSGGADIDPTLYGETPNGAGETEADRDELELAAWAEAERRELPVLGICRGLQAVNVFSGGGLLQHVPDHQGPSYGLGHPLLHRLEIDPSSRLGELFGPAEGSPEVNSYHHQAVGPAQLAGGLRASGWADSGDGRIVEALERADGRWLMAVQCHPERIESTPPVFDRLWEAFVAAARAAAERAPAVRGAG